MYMLCLYTVSTQKFIKILLLRFKKLKMNVVVTTARSHSAQYHALLSRTNEQTLQLYLPTLNTYTHIH